MAPYLTSEEDLEEIRPHTAPSGVVRAGIGELGQVRPGPDKDSSGGVGNRGFERRSALRDCRCRRNSAVHTTRNATAPTTTAMVMAAPALCTASTAIAAARAASTVAMTAGVLTRKRPQGRRPRPGNEVSR